MKWRVAPILFLMLVWMIPVQAKDLRVLVLNSYHKADWSDSVLAGVRSVLDSVPNIQISVDYMDTKRTESAEYLDQLDTIFRIKYAKSNFDGIIAVDDQAYRFLLRRGEAIFGKVPISFCGVNDFTDSAWVSYSHVTGVVEEGDFANNIELAKRIKPQASVIHVIADNTTTGLSNLKLLLHHLENDNRLKPQIHIGISLDSLAKVLRNANKNDVAFFIAFWKNLQGDVIHPDSLGAVFKQSSIPVLGRSEWMIGRGMLGGVCVIGSRQGKEAALRLLQLFNSPTGKSVPVLLKSPNTLLIDARLLKGYLISQNLIKGANSFIANEIEIRHAPSSSLSIQYSTLVMVAIFVFVVIVLGIALLLSLYRRNQLSVALSKRESEYRILVESQSDLVVRVTIDGVFLYASPSYCNYFGVTSDQLLGKSFHPKVHPDDLANTLNVMEKIKEAPYRVYLEQRVITDLGERWLSWNDTALLNENNEVVEIIGVGHDITDRKTTQIERDRLIGELERKNFELERFAYTVSHDLRSPLLTMTGFAKEMQFDLQAGENTYLNDYAERILVAGERMGNLLEAVLYLSRVGRVTAAPIRVNVRESIQDVLQLLDALIKSKSVNIEWNIKQENLFVSVDKQRLQEVFQNIIENAIKYMGDQVSPKIVIEILKKQDNILISFIDNGMGVPENQLDRIFGLFSKVNASSAGLGFGLALCRHVLQFMHGRIWATSEGLGKGTQMHIQLPEATH